jgi:hypothetical protein
MVDNTTKELEKNKEQKTAQVAVYSHQEREQSLKIMFLCLIQEVHY